MMRSLFSGVSGLKNHQTRMDVIGNNISNVNTAGFKGSRVVFQDMLSQTIQSASSPQGNRGGTNPQQVGLGVGIGSIDTIYSDGNVQSTGKNTDLCISGNGFFIVSDGANKIYSRAGAFEFDEEGNYVIPGSGLKVQGWMADADGNVSTNGEITNIQIPKGQTIPAKATDSLTYTKNLSSDAKVPQVATGSYTDNVAAFPTEGVTIDKDGNVTQIKCTAGTAGTAGAVYTTTITNINGTVRVTEATYTQNADGITWDIDADTTTTTPTRKTAQVISYDSLGAAHTVTGVFEKTATNEWTFYPGVQRGVVDQNGNPVLDGAGDPTYARYTDTGYEITGGIYKISFDSAGAVINVAGNDPITFSPTGAEIVKITPDFTKMTQYAGDSTATCTGKTGYSAGTLDSVSIDTTGTIIGIYTNGLNRNLAQVAMAIFNNPPGLTKTGTSLYQQSNNSGEAQISAANTGGAGKITPSSLEMSNVDLSEEFSNMIITQRGFQANSKIITTSDEMIEILTNLKR